MRTTITPSLRRVSKSKITKRIATFLAVLLTIGGGISAYQHIDDPASAATLKRGDISAASSGGIVLDNNLHKQSASRQRGYPARFGTQRSGRYAHLAGTAALLGWRLPVQKRQSKEKQFGQLTQIFSKLRPSPHYKGTKDKMEEVAEPLPFLYWTLPLVSKTEQEHYRWRSMACWSSFFFFISSPLSLRNEEKLLPYLYVCDIIKRTKVIGVRRC